MMPGAILRRRAPFSVMGIVNVTPDSFSDGGRFLDADAAVQHGARAGGGGRRRSSTSAASPRARAPSPCRPTRSSTASCRWSSGLAAAGQPGLDRHHQARGRARRRSTPGATLRQRRRPPFASTPSSPGWWPSAAPTAASMHMRGEPRTMQDDPRYDDVVSRGARRSSRSGSPSRSAEGDRRGADLARPGHRLRQDGRAQPRAAAPPRRDRRDRPPGGDRHVAQELPRQARRRRREATSALPGTIATNVLALERGASVFRVHDVGPVVDALAVAAATVAR